MLPAVHILLEVWEALAQGRALDEVLDSSEEAWQAVALEVQVRHTARGAVHFAFGEEEQASATPVRETPQQKVLRLGRLLAAKSPHTEAVSAELVQIASCALEDLDRAIDELFKAREQVAEGDERRRELVKDLKFLIHQKRGRRVTDPRSIQDLAALFTPPVASGRTNDKEIDHLHGIISSLTEELARKDKTLTELRKQAPRQGFECSLSKPRQLLLPFGYAPAKRQASPARPMSAR
mmetsp:Transcript_22832/g.58378  ORF Transcript_22832/g.58378 Transcript_22832/m.58378 type:complete len:237 (-) Transcript_22832:95-805(-)